VTRPNSFESTKNGAIFLLLGLGIGLFFLVYSATLYSQTFFQIWIGWLLLFLLFALKRVPFFQETPGRIFFLLLAGFISLRYWMFRTFDTLIFVSFQDSLGMMLLWLAETYGILIYFLGMFISIWPLPRKAAPLSTDRAQWPTVDIFIPTFDESEEIVMITAIACTQMDYPREKLNIFILDDGATLERRSHPDLAKARAAWERYHSLQAICSSLGVTYLSRATNAHAKAGNLNEALRVRSVQAAPRMTSEKESWLQNLTDIHTTVKEGAGDLILFLDCDHVPTKDFLRNTVGYFQQDEKLFLVQTPHFFINPNPVEKNLRTSSESPGENEMFYGSVQLGLDFWNSSFFCGSAAILRRRHIEEIGGIQGETITEDAETALALHAKGYRSLYMARPMTCGLSPETFDDFIIQRTRWTQGMIQIFTLKNPLFLKGLTLAQRLCYLNSCLFWFFGLARLIFFISPLLYLYFGLRVYNASGMQVVAYAFPHIFGSLLVTGYLYGKVRPPFFSELYEAVQSIYLAPALLSTLIHPRSPRFHVTPKGKNLLMDFLSPLARPFYFLFFLSLGAVPMAIWRWWSYPMEKFAILICAFWGIFNFLFVLLCLGVVWELQQRRRYHRIWAEGKVEVQIPRLGISVPGELQDISLGGISIQAREDAPVGENERVVIMADDSYGKSYALQATVVRRAQRNGRASWGCELDIPDVASFREIVSFVYGDSQRWVRFWELRRAQRVNAMRSLYYLLKLGFTGAMRNFRGIFLPYWLKSKNYARGLGGGLRQMQPRIKELFTVR
jgi:cellulose synthase (UDP-forming)